MAAPLLRPSALVPADALCAPDAVSAWCDRGYSVIGWTVDEVARASALHRAGALGVITNRPAILRPAWR
jgi:glycerophosphoryl diester phosphodiesterase